MATTTKKTQTQLLEEIIERCVRKVLQEDRAQRLYEQQMYQPQYQNWLPPVQPAYQPQPVAPRPAPLDPQMQMQYQEKMRQQFERMQQGGDLIQEQNYNPSAAHLPTPLKDNPFAAFITPKPPKE